MAGHPPYPPGEPSQVGEWCFALHGNHDEHQCSKKPGHHRKYGDGADRHECYCGVWW